MIVIFFKFIIFSKVLFSEHIIQETNLKEKQVGPAILNPQPILTVLPEEKRQKKPGPSMKSPFKDRVINMKSPNTAEEDMISEWLFNLKGNVL